MQSELKILYYYAFYNGFRQEENLIFIKGKVFDSIMTFKIYPRIMIHNFKLRRKDEKID